jgi:hypothetical protein
MIAPEALFLNTATVLKARSLKVCHYREIFRKNPIGKLRDMRTYYLPLIGIALALAGASVIVIYL